MVLVLMLVILLAVAIFIFYRVFQCINVFLPRRRRGIDESHREAQRRMLWGQPNGLTRESPGDGASRVPDSSARDDDGSARSVCDCGESVGDSMHGDAADAEADHAPEITGETTLTTLSSGLPTYHDVAFNDDNNMGDLPSYEDALRTN